MGLLAKTIARAKPKWTATAIEQAQAAPLEDIAFKLIDDYGLHRMAAVTPMGREVGRIQFTPLPDASRRVSLGRIDDQYRGKGLGERMYRALIDDTLANGGHFASDKSVSAAASKMYGRLAQDGYRVIRGPSRVGYGYMGSPNAYYGRQGGSVFVIPNPRAASAPERDIWREVWGVSPLDYWTIKGGRALQGAADNVALDPTISNDLAFGLASTALPAGLGAAAYGALDYYGNPR